MSAVVGECFGNNYVHMYVSELTSRIVAKSGIPSDRFHLGKITLQSLEDDPDFVLQIDGATGESETNGSVLNRSVKCATSLRNMGLKKDDVMILMAPNHLDLTIPFYAGWYLGIGVAPADRTMTVYDLQNYFDLIRPNIVFCQSERVLDIQKALALAGVNCTVISFDKSPDTLSFSEMMDKYGGDSNVEEFRPVDLNPDETIALLISTSGTTGMPKAAAMTHKNISIGGPYTWCFSTKFPSPTRSALMVAPLQWLSTLLNFNISTYLKYTRVQTSAEVTPEHTLELIQKYKTTFVVSSPTMLSTLLKVAEEKNYDVTSFELMYIGGSAVSTELLQQLKRLSPNTIIHDTFGMSELGAMGFQCVGAPRGSMGQRLGFIQYRLVDVETKADIKEPNKPGELWVKGPSLFKGYYRNPKATEEAFSEDGWFMTGDLMYRDASWNFYYVDRIKLLLKFRNHQVSPVEIETVIRQHPGVLDVAVTGIPHPEDGDLPVACVVLRPDSNLTAQDIKDLVKEKLTDTKQLRGGVLFLKELPLTPSTKLHRRKLKEIVMEKRNELELQNNDNDHKKRRSRFSAMGLFC